MMMEGAGFEDLGINNPVENYLEALEEHKPDILGMSALLTTTMPYMKVVIETERTGFARRSRRFGWWRTTERRLCHGDRC